MAYAVNARLARDRQQLSATARALNALSPLQTLGRGYAIIRRLPGGEVVRRAPQVKQNERVEAVLSEGRLVCKVIEIEPAKDVP